MVGEVYSSGYRCSYDDAKMRQGEDKKKESGERGGRDTVEEEQR
jgi:hypothetical protein